MVIDFVLIKIMNKFIYFFFIATFISQAQSKNDSIKDLNEVLITSQKVQRNKAFITQKINSIDRKEIEFQNFQNTADLLSNSGIATVQKSQQGGGSPILRGFEANRVLLVVDGIRMNNLIFRAGHLQNVISVDENMLDNVTVLFGSSSTLFGSDALGGTINMSTKKPKFLLDYQPTLSGSVNTRYSTVNKEKAIHFDLNYAQPKWATLTSFSFNDFDDLKMGKRQNGSNPFFGERNSYVETLNNVDFEISNSDKYLQKFSGYSQIDVMQKIAFHQENKNRHNLNFQFSTTTNIPRYDRLTNVGSKNLRNSEWYYGPQKRILAVYNFNKEKAVLNSDFSVDVSYQNVLESRHTRRFGNPLRENRLENVSVAAINTLLKLKLRYGELLYGTESNYDQVKSSAFRNNINSGVMEVLDTRYPNGQNYTFKNDIFVTYNETFSEKTKWNSGIRLGYSILKSTLKNNSFLELPFSSIHQKNKSYSANIGIIHKPSSEVSLIANLSSGYRTPNIDDLAKIFESTETSLIVPNEYLKPEKTITADFGIRFENKTFEWETNYYYTRLYDAIVTDTYTFNNSSTILYNGNLSQVFANQNNGKAFVTGISSDIELKISEPLTASATINYTLGRIVKEVFSPLDHIPPYYGKVGLKYTKTSFGIEVFMLYNGKKDIKDYLLNGEDNEQYAPKNGMPAWETYQIKTSFKVLKNGMLFVGIENILDTQYRTFASGMNAPGRNFYTGLKYSF
jgi:hemoglobin/transferrin/lactoferrin receptor protein